MRNRTLPRRLLTGLVAMMSLAACSAPAEQTQTWQPPNTTAESTPATVATQTVQTGGVLSADGSLVVPGRAIPEKSIILSFPRGGTIAEWLVQAGDNVQAGAPLVRLESSALELEVESARAGLRQAQADYESLTSGASPADVAQAAARLDRARANLQEVAATITEKDVEAARRLVAERELILEQRLKGPLPEEIAQAEERISQARIRLEDARVAAAAEKALAEASLLQAANDVRTYQDTYSRIYWTNRNQYGDDVPVRERDREAEALRNVENLQETLRKREVELEEARQRELNAIGLAESELRRLEEARDLLLREPLPESIEAARRELADAQARLESLLGDERAAELAQAEASVAEAQANLDDLVADPASPDLAIAEARIVRAEVALKQAELALSQATLRAPIDGIVASVAPVVGEMIAANTEVLVLASLSSWQVETEELNELNVVAIREGDRAIIQFFALPGKSLEGTVTRIDAVGRNDRNLGTVYTVTITPDTWDDRLRWNMTASVRIVPSR